MGLVPEDDDKLQNLDNILKYSTKYITRRLSPQFVSPKNGISRLNMLLLVNK
jgi:hypothetical protein